MRCLSRADPPTGVGVIGGIGGIGGISIIVPSLGQSPWQEEVLAGDSAAGLAAYEKWRSGRAEEIAKGSRLAFDIFSPSETTQPPQGSSEEIGIAEIARPAGRSFGSHFGTLVHAVLRDIDFGAGREAVEAQVELQSRIMGARDDERQAAVEAVVVSEARVSIDRAWRRASDSPGGLGYRL